MCHMVLHRGGIQPLMASPIANLTLVLYLLWGGVPPAVCTLHSFSLSPWASPKSIFPSTSTVCQAFVFF